MIDTMKGWTFVAAELVFVLARSRDILVVFRKEQQRTKEEQRQADRGLVRGLLLEAVVFVPASACLLILIAPSLVPVRWLEGGKVQAFYSILGVVSYGFPFATFKRVITRLALKTLLEFASLTPKTPDPEAEQEGGQL